LFFFLSAAMTDAAPCAAAAADNREKDTFAVPQLPQPRARPAHAAPLAAASAAQPAAAGSTRRSAEHDAVVQGVSARQTLEKPRPCAVSICFLPTASFSSAPAGLPPLFLLLDSAVVDCDGPPLISDVVSVY
jgi:hypothetical protein